MEKINVAEKLSLINDHWNPRIAAELNVQHVRLVKIIGEFVWHTGYFTGSDISLYEISRHSCVSPFHFSRVFPSAGACLPFSKLVDDFLPCRFPFIV
jgi:hypothetical protein